MKMLAALRHYLRSKESDLGLDFRQDHGIPLFEKSEKHPSWETDRFIKESGDKRLAQKVKRRSHRITQVLGLIVLVALIFLSGSPVIASTKEKLAALFGNELSRKDGERERVPSFMPAAPPWQFEPINAQPLDKKGWDLECSSNVPDCKKLIDENGDTTWKSAAAKTHFVVIDLKRVVSVHSLEVAPSEDDWKAGGAVRKHRVEIAKSRGQWEQIAFGAWRSTDGKSYATFEPQEAQYLRLTIIDTTLDRDFVEISELNIFAGNPASTSRPSDEGKWTVTLNFPVVPVTAFVDPISKDVITMAAFLPYKFDQSPNNPQVTYTATWDATTGLIHEEVIGKGHDMFCPGTSFDEQGRVLVTGGESPKAFSIYDPKAENKWSAGAPIAIARGYQGQTFLPDGKTFMIGGEWSGGASGPRDGEIYDPVSQKWAILRNIAAETINMAPSVACSDPNWKACNVTEWQKHHPWLYAWKEGSIFHAGPSKEMHWFFPNSPGGAVKTAGPRDKDNDAVCGIAAMYDAENGEILTAGGATNYHYWLTPDDQNKGHRNESSTNAFKIKLASQKPGDTVEVKSAMPLKFQRIFANSVIFPNGEVFVVGGQSKGEPFRDENWQPFPEIYSPKEDKWRVAARHSTPRVYHSWALLLPDATVLVGGSGLSDLHKTNHYDAQIYQPGYLFLPNGSPADRPKIDKLTQSLFKVGEKITFTTNETIDDASLIRYSAATHALNNDLRRIKLTPVLEDAGQKRYSVKIPNDSGVALPGYWMLFALKNNVPSVSQTLQILAK